MHPMPSGKLGLEQFLSTSRIAKTRVTHSALLGRGGGFRPSTRRARLPLIVSRCPTASPTLYEHLENKTRVSRTVPPSETLSLLPQQPPHPVPQLSPASWARAPSRCREVLRLEAHLPRFL